MKEEEDDLVFRRTYESRLCENDRGGITVAAQMKDLIHDIRIKVDVSLPDLVITNPVLTVEQAPHHLCQELRPRIDRLEGVPIRHGFTQLVREIFGGADGCPNVVNLLLTSVPLAVNASWMVAMRHGAPSTEIEETRDSQMKDVCIAFRARPEEK